MPEVFLRHSSNLICERSFLFTQRGGGAHHPGHGLKKDQVPWQQEGKVPTEPDSGTVEGALSPPVPGQA